MKNNHQFRRRTNSGRSGGARQSLQATVDTKSAPIASQGEQTTWPSKMLQVVATVGQPVIRSRLPLSGSIQPWLRGCAAAAAYTEKHQKRRRRKATAIQPRHLERCCRRMHRLDDEHANPEAVNKGLVDDAAQPRTTVCDLQRTAMEKKPTRETPQSRRCAFCRPA